ncbi:hypothetical protein DMC47_12035 [Nostoc sp. 3335mG]|nr:hypothetical protein DMC47_12035 [Nostoc sp. 3335mG]
MKKLVFAIVGTLGVLSGGAALATQHAKKPWVTEAAQIPGRAGTEHTVAVIKSGKNLETVSCHDFNLLDETFKPEAIRYAANYGPKGKPHPTVTVAGVETIRPVVLANCKAQPGNKFTAAVNAALKQH